VALGLSAWFLLRPRYDYVWNARDALPAAINAPDVEVYEPNFTPDGRFLIFTRGCAGHNTDLYIVPVARNGMPAGEPALIRGVASDYDEIDGMLGRDGVLYFYSDRPGGFGGYDLYAARRQADGTFAAPENLGPNVNSEHNDYDPCLSPDGTFLYFSSNRHSAGSEEDYDLYVCLRTDAGWSKPRALSGVNTPANEWEPMLARDGRTLYLTSNRPRPGPDGTPRTDYDLYAASLTRDQGWGNPVNLGPEVNSEHDEFDPAINPRNDALLFVRGIRDGDRYEVRIWNAAPRPVPLGPILRLDRFPRTALLVLAALAATLALLWALIAAWERLSTLQRCLLASLAAHGLAAWILTMVAMKSRFDELRQSDSAFSVYTDLPEDLAQDVLLSALFRDERDVKVSRAPRPAPPTLDMPEPVQLTPAPAPAPAPEATAAARTPAALPELAFSPLPDLPPTVAQEVRGAADAAPTPERPAQQPPVDWAALPAPAFTPEAPARPEPVAAVSPRTPRADAREPLATLPLAESAPPTIAAPRTAQAPPAAAAPTTPTQRLTDSRAVALPAPPAPADAPSTRGATVPEVAATVPHARQEGRAPVTPMAPFTAGAAEAQAAERTAAAAAPPGAADAPPPAKPTVPMMPAAAGAAVPPPLFAVAAAPAPAPAAGPPRPPRPPGAASAALPQAVLDWTPRGVEQTAATAGTPPTPGPGPASQPPAPGRPPTPVAQLAALPRAPAQVEYRPAALLPAPTPTLGASRRVADRERVSRIEWGRPENLGPTINAGGETYEPNLSADGRTLVFTRGSAGGEANLYRSERTASGWTQPVPLDALNSDYDDIDATTDGEGRTILFYSNRPDGLGGYDLYMSTRGDNGDWGAPANLGAPVNSPWNDYDPHLSRDGTRLFFASNRHSLGSEDDYDLYLCERRDDGTWGEPIRLPIHTAANDWEPALSPDALSLYFSSNRRGGRGGYDIWVSHWRDGQWQSPVPLDGAVNSEHDELDPAVSPDGETLFFVSNREGAHGTFDIWQARRRLAE
jgi:Tol biopolymer transport system component